MEEVIPLLLQAGALPIDAARAIRDCVDGVQENWFEGWLVAWWMPQGIGIEFLDQLGNTVPSERGWNVVFVGDRDALLDIVIDAADQGSSCTVIDIEACF